jgi:hypothetical protein
MRTEWAEGEVCVDCAMWHANGDTSGIDDPEHEARVRLVTQHVIIGEPVGFSWRRCEACGDSRGGDRFDASFVIEY